MEDTEMPSEDSPVNNPFPLSPIHPTAQAVRDALATAAEDGSWRQYEGPSLVKLRSVLAESLDRKHVRLCCSGTFAVELALRSLKLPLNAEVLLAGYDFPGNFRAIQDAGASVCLCDVEVNSWVPTAASLEQAVGPNTKAIVVSHLHGALAPMPSICQWAKQRGLFVIEDACQVHGASMNGKPAGSWGDLGVFSFGGSKLIAAGRGGAVVTNDDRYAQRMTVFCERGNDSFALSELQATVILPQLAHLQIDHALRLDAALDWFKSMSRFDWLSLCPLQEADSPLQETGGLKQDAGAIEQPAFYKIGLLVHPSILQSTLVRQIVHKSTNRSESPLSIAREWVLGKLADYQTNTGQQIEMGVGFKGFVKRSASRCRQPVPLDNSRIAADATLVLHHSHLLDPSTGANTIDRVLAAFDSIHAEILS